MVIKPLVVAQQLCLLDHRLMRQVDPTEVLTAIWRSSMSDEEKAEELPNLVTSLAFKKSMRWVHTCVHA